MTMKSFNNLPFTYIWLHRKAIGAEIKTILDLGCGDGKFMTELSQGKDWNITGVELFKPSAKAAKKTGTYKKVVIGDIIDVAKKLREKGEKFDVIFCSHLIEHLSKSQGEKLLVVIDKLALKRAVIGTPNGFMAQIEESLGKNAHQAHISGWDENDFYKHKYKVFGIGLKVSWAYFGQARSSNKIIAGVFRLLALVVSPLVYYVPPLGAGILAVKKYER